MTRTRLTLVALVLLVVPAEAILIRHDKDDQAYRALAEQFAAVGKIGRAGAGTLVGPTWVATAAHVATGFRRQLGVTFGTRTYEVADVIAHLDWRDGGPHDIALIRLSRAVEGVTPIAIYAGNAESGMAVTFVGPGGTGTGLTGPRSEDGIMRAATNVIDRADEQWLYFDFDEPGTATDLEGISGPGDSGGPALVRAAAGTGAAAWQLAGVSVWGRAGAQGHGTYGAQEGYTRVSRYAAWLAGVMKDK